MSEAIKHQSLDEALAAAQGEFGLLAKDKTANAGAKVYKYADIADVLNLVRPVLSKHGIAVTQRMRMDEEILMLRTEVRGYGDALSSDAPIMAQLTNPQAVGSALSYMRRYALCSLVGVAADEDDDGEAAKASPPDRRPQPRPAPRTLAAAGPDRHPSMPPHEAEDYTPLPPRAASPIDALDVGEHTFIFGKERLTAPEWLDAVSRKARDPDTDPKALQAWWTSEKQTAERARFHKLKHELNPMLEAVKQEVMARFQTPGRVNGQPVSPDQALSAG